MNPNLRGAIAEAAISLEAMKAGVEVLRPVSEHCRYDLVFGLGSRLMRVQCKSATRTDAVLIVRLVSSWHSPRGYVRSRYLAGEVDLVAAHCPELNRSYLLPFELVEGKTAIQLRLSAARNNQKASIHLAREYEFPGAIAQLGERLHGMQEVAGSSPASSISATPDRTAIGANQFRDRFGYWMERAAAGDEILITRHGRPFTRLISAGPQERLALESD